MVTAPALKPLSHITRCLFWLAGGGALAFAFGFCYFVVVAERPQNAPFHTDGIVVLTGGAERVETGLRLMAAGRADWLLVSGVAHSADLPSLAHFAGVNTAPLAQKITLGHAASSTRGNANETAIWTRLHDIHTLIVVTGFIICRGLSQNLPETARKLFFIDFPWSRSRCIVGL